MNITGKDLNLIRWQLIGGEKSGTWMPSPRLRPWPHPFFAPSPARHIHPLSLTDHSSHPRVLQSKAKRRFSEARGHRLLEAGGICPAATSAAPTGLLTSSIRALRRPPFRSTWHCRASPGSNDPWGGVGACFLLRHGSVRKIRRVRRRSRLALHHSTVPS